MEKIKTILDTLRENNLLYNLYYFFLHFIPMNIGFMYLFLRKSVSTKYNFKGIKKYKNIHNGKRCFVVATAPSLKIDDLDLLKAEYSFGVNSIANIFEKTTWRPTYYGIQDRGVEVAKDNILKYRSDIKEFFVGISANKNLVPHFECEQVNYLLNLLDHDKRGTKHILKTTKDADKFLYDGFSITFSMIELAMYMGFKEIMLLGVDCDYSGNKTHIDDYTQIRIPNASVNMYKAFCQMNSFAQKNGIKIINCSRGHKLKAFECMELEDVF